MTVTAKKKKAVKPVLKTFKLIKDYPPKKKGDSIKLNAEGERILKIKKLI